MASMTILNSSENEFKPNRTVVPSPPSGYEYRHCQETCFQKIMEKINNNDKKLAIQMPCGSGKTLLMWMFAMTLKDNGIVVLFVPRKDIAIQTCHTMNLWGGNAAVFDGENHLKNVDSFKMVVCVSNSAANLYKLIANQRIGCVFTDEAHINNEGKFRDKIELFCTNCVHIQLSATLPSTITPDYTYTVSDAMTAEIIAPAVLNAIGVTSGNRHEIFVEHIVSNRKRLGKMMVVNSTRNGARIMEKKLKQKRLNVKYIDGETKTVERSKILNNDNWECLVVVNCCTVGTDIPTLKSVVFVDIRYSKMQIIQTAMRCMRYQQGKTATIVFPVITDESSSSSSSSSLKVTTANEMFKTLLMMDTNEFDSNKTVLDWTSSISCGGLNTEDTEKATLLFNLMIENNKPQTLPEYWELFEKYIHDFSDKKRKSLSKENKEKIFKHARALFNGKAELKGKKLMDGLKITLNLNLSEIHAIAGDFRNLHGDPGNGYTLTHPLSKLNQFKLYLQTEHNISFQNQHSSIVNHNKMTCLVYQTFKNLLRTAKHIVNDAKKQQLSVDRLNILEIPDNLEDQIYETKDKCGCSRCVWEYLCLSIVKIAKNAVKIVNGHKKRKRDDHTLDDNKKQKIKEAQAEALSKQILEEFQKLKKETRVYQCISRNGQPKMRKELLDEFASSCPATGENNEEFLEAAHLVPFRDIHHCESSNGLLLDMKIHRALDNGHLTYDGNGQLWRRHNFNIHHLSICNAQLPSGLLTTKRKKWLEQAYMDWLTHYKINENDLCKVEIESSK
jgi:superfamily II DNA or RNA helicase